MNAGVAVYIADNQQSAAPAMSPEDRAIAEAFFDSVVFTAAGAR
ncbi:MAG: hypothetical protein ACJA1L_001051 [Paracoccaceae bacterium]|jgi:hypothetical protein